MFFGCASKSERINKEYDLVSQQIEDLRNELKAIVKTKSAAEQYLKAKQEYEQQKAQLQKIREKNQAQGLPSGPEIKNVEKVEEALQALQKNDDFLSDKVRELEKKRNTIVKERHQLQP
jgi:chromosome segregation ATPase